MATFIIKKDKFQVRGEAPQDMFNEQVLARLAMDLTGDSTYSVRWEPGHNEGQFAKLVTPLQTYYICLSKSDPGEGRNSYLQSSPTAFANFMNEIKNHRAKGEFVVALRSRGRTYLTDYQKFVVRMLITIGVKIIDLTNYNLNRNIQPFSSIEDMIRTRQASKRANNNPTFFTDEGENYHLYGKTFGANGKETALLCYAMMKISTKPIRLFQILDNGESSLSGEDVQAFALFANFYCTPSMDILDDTYEIDEFTSQAYPDTSTLKLRQPRFIYNLLEKTNGEKKCALCDCKISPLIQAAHIYSVADIKKNGSLTDNEKVRMATDGNNGMWLCMHHHKLFDSAILRISPHGISFVKTDEADSKYIEHSLKEQRLPTIYMNTESQKYFSMRKF